MKKWLKHMFFASAMLPAGAFLAPEKRPFVFAEEVFHELGLDPGLVKEKLSGRKVLVFNNSAASRAALKKAERENGFDPNQVSMSGSFTWTQLNVGAYKDACVIYFNPNELKSADDTMMLFVPNEMDAKRWSILHEFFHCLKKPEYKDSTLLSERDADIQAIDVLKDTTPGLAEGIILFRSSYPSLLAEGYNVDLFLDAYYRGLSMPDKMKVIDSIDEVVPAEEAMLAGRAYNRKLSPLAQRRMELFKKAWSQLPQKQAKLFKEKLARKKLRP